MIRWARSGHSHQQAYYQQGACTDYVVPHTGPASANVYIWCPTSGLSVFPIGSFCSALSSVVSRLFVPLPSSDVNRSLVDLIDLFLNTPLVPRPGRTTHFPSLPIHPHTMSPTPMSPINRLAHPERTSSQDSTDGIRKRVCKACDRCRLKKSKCDGSSPCSRCKADNAICVFGYVSTS